MDPIRILQINKLYYPETGGIERVVQYIAEGLKDQTDMEVLVCRKKGGAVKEEINGVPVWRAKSYGVACSMPLSLDFLRRFRLMARDRDIIQFHMPFPLGDVAGLLSGYRGKVVLWWHSDVVKQKRAMLLYKPFMNWLLKRADLILVASQRIVDGSHYLSPYREKCRIIPLAVGQDIWEDGDRYCREQEQKAPDSDLQRRVRFLFVGRLVYYKGCSVLIEAMEQVPRGELTLIGSGELEEELRSLVRRLGMEERVHFAGAVSDEEMKQYFRDTDVFVLPSIARSEAFGIVQMEAMSYGKPVINTWLPSGVPDVSLDGVTGITVEPEQPRALAEAMNRLAENREEREAFGRAAKERVDSCFVLSKVLPQIYDTYEELVRG